MAACSDHEKTLVLDAHGALVPEERIAWERHLADCEDCRQEREMLCELLQKAKNGFSVPALTPEEEQRLSGRVQRALRTAKPDARPQRVVWWLAPAVAACMVLLVAGWFGLRNLSPYSAAIATKRISAAVASNNKKLPANPGHTAAVINERVPEEVVSNNKELPENPVPDTAAITTERVPEEQVISNNKELLENMDMLEEMDSLEQLVKLLDEQEQETTLLERETDENHVSDLA